MTMPDLENVEITAEAELWAWLEQHHAQTDGVLLITHKKSQGARYVGRDAVLDALVAFGWIDGRRFTVDDKRTAQLITPRRVQHWSQSYKTRAQKLIEEGRMTPAGQASIDAGKASGLWDFMADVDALITPPDLEAALIGPAATYYETCPDAYKRNLLRWVKLAKTDATRAKRVSAIAAACAKGERIPQF